MGTIERDNKDLEVKVVKKTKNKKKKRKALILVLVLGLTAVVLTVSTYAWFVGINTVQISEISVSVQTSKGLLAALDAENFSDDVKIIASSTSKNASGTKLITAKTKNVTGLTTLSDAEKQEEEKNKELAYIGANNYWPTAQSSASNVTTQTATNTTNILTPVSTIGEIDTTTSTMKFYETKSLTSTGGGYTITAEQVNSTTVSGQTANIQEGDGYVAFDLFIQNENGTYNTAYDEETDEGVYLNPDTTSVTLTKDGTTVANIGYENGMRVAFMQIGRIKSYTVASERADRNTSGYSKIEEAAYMRCGGKTLSATAVSSATGSTNDEKLLNASKTLTNYTTNTDITDLCDTEYNGKSQLLSQGRTWNIWEPNATTHTTASVTHFNTYCKQRNANGTYTNTNCTAITASEYVQTYAINQAFGYTFNTSNTSEQNANLLTDRYDGLNGRTSSNLSGMYYYTNNPFYDLQWYVKATGANTNAWTQRTKDEMKTTAYPAIFYIQPQSVTKLRVYIYLEGQDIDTYDLLSGDLKINVIFGLTKTAPSKSETFDTDVDASTIPTTLS